MPPHVTVLIDTYNHERFIEQALTSVLDQDFPPSDREILVVDDGSTDRTPEILRKFAGAARVIQKPNGGQGSAFNAAIAEARGQIVAFLDGDDWWAPGKLMRVVEAMSADPTIGMVGHGIVISSEGGESAVETLREGFCFRANEVQGAKLFRLRKNFLGTSRMTIRADLLRQIGRVPEAIAIQADEYLFTIAAVLANVQVLPEALTYYRIHGGNLYQFQSGDAERIRRKWRCLDALEKALAARIRELGVSREVQLEITEIIRAEANRLRLTLGDGRPWETVWAEWKIYDVLNPTAARAQRALKMASLLPALFVPPRHYYRYREAMARNGFYQRARRWLPLSRRSGHSDLAAVDRPPSTSGPNR